MNMAAMRRFRGSGRQFAVLGLGRFGSSVARTLHELGHEVLAIDKDEERIQEMADFVTHAAQCDATDEAALQSLGIRNVDVGVVAIGELQASILATLALKEAQVPEVVAKATSRIHGEVLRRVGADRVVFPERDMGVRLAHSLVAANLIDYIELSPGFNVAEFLAPPEWQGKNLQELDLRRRFNVHIVAIKGENRVTTLPSGEDRVHEGDFVIALGPAEVLERLANGED